MKSTIALLAIFGTTVSISLAADLAPRVEIEEDVYTYTPANNGAGPMWCSGSTCLVRTADRVFASGLETVPDAPLLNNCRWTLFERGANVWDRMYVDTDGRTREPAPLASFADGRVFVSANPAIDPKPGGGPARPDVFEFCATDSKATPTSLTPIWQGDPPFSEHSYRSFAADRANQELVLFQNIDYTHAEWTFFDRTRRWSARGQLKWPWGADYEKPGPIRVCYPNVALHDRAVYFVGVSDIHEPHAAWAEYKRQLTGQEWDYDFRRLFFTWTPDITKQPFAEWVEVASRDKTCGWISPGDLWLAPDGIVHLVWTERALDERLREKFFPTEKQGHFLNYAQIRNGQVIERRTLLSSTDDKPGLIGSAPRFQVTPDNRLFVVHLATGRDPVGQPVRENRVLEIVPNGATAALARIPLKHPFSSYFTATVRGGSPPSTTLEMLGQRDGGGSTISYARVQLLP